MTTQQYDTQARCQGALPGLTTAAQLNHTTAHVAFLSQLLDHMP